VHCAQRVAVSLSLSLSLYDRLKIKQPISTDVLLPSGFSAARWRSGSLYGSTCLLLSDRQSKRWYAVRRSLRLLARSICCQLSLASIRRDVASDHATQSVRAA